MSAAHGKQPTELTPEQEEEQKQKERFAPDRMEQDTESVFSQFFTFAAAMGWGKIKGDREQFELFQAISNTHLSEVILDLSNPQNIKDARALYATVKKEFDRQNFDPKTKTYKKATASRGSLWGKATISTDTLTKADQQITVGEHFHSLVNSHETNTRIDQAVSIYGIKNREEFVSSLAKHLKENSGNFDDAIHTVVRHQTALEKTGKKDGNLNKEQDNALNSSYEKFSKQELKDEARQKAVEYGESIKPEAEEVMVKIKAGLDPDQLQTELNAIGKPVQEPEPPPSPIQPPASGSISLEALGSGQNAPHPEMDELYGEMMGESPTVVVPAGSPSLKGAVNAINNPQTPIPHMSSVSSPVGSVSVKGLKGLLGKAAGLFSKLKSLASTLSNATLAIPGVGEIVKGLQIAKKVLDRIPIIGQAVNNAINNAFSTLLKVFGLSLAAIFLFLLIFITSFSDPSTLFSPTPSNLVASNPSNLSWSTFEKDYLQLAEKKEEKDISWIEFQKQ